MVGVALVGATLGGAAPAAVAGPSRPSRAEGRVATAAAARAVDPLVARGCWVPVMTRDAKGNVTFQMLGTGGNLLRSSLGKVTAGARLATAAGVYGDGDPRTDTVLGTGVVTVTAAGRVVHRKVYVSGSTRRTPKVSFGPARVLSNESRVKLIASDWESVNGGTVLLNWADGTVGGRVTDDGEEMGGGLVDTQGLFERRFPDLTSLTFDGRGGGMGMYAQTKAGDLIELVPFQASASRARITIGHGWRSMSRVVPAFQCTAERRGERTFVAADRAGRFHVYSLVGHRLTRLGVTAGRATGRVL